MRKAKEGRVTIRLESDLEHQFLYFCRSLGVRCEKLRLASESSWPDRTLLYKGRVLFMELKRRGERPTPLQQFTIDKLRNQGFEAHYCDNLDDAKDLVLEWRNLK